MSAWGWACGMVSGAALISALGGCRSEPDCAASARPNRATNFRTLREVDGRLVPQFDELRLPRVRLADDERLCLKQGRHLLELDAKSAAARFSDLQAGPASLQIVKGERCEAWPIRWAPTPREHPEIKRVAATLDGVGSTARVAGWAAALDELSEDGRLWASVEWARAVGRARGGRAGAEAWLSAADVARAVGAPNEEARRARAAAFHAARAGAFVLADQALARAARIPHVADRRSRFGMPFSLGVLAFRTGQTRRSIRYLETAVERAGDDLALAFEAVMTLALSHSQTGDHGSALRIAELSFEGAELGTSALRRVHVNRGWVRARAMADGAVPTDWSAVRRDYESAARLATAGSPVWANIQVNLAEVDLRTGDVSAAQARLASLPVTNQDPFVELLAAECASRSDGATAARARYLALAASLVERDPSSPVLWQAWAGAARMARELGDGASAAHDYVETLRVLGESLRFTPINQVRQAALFRRDVIEGEALSVLVDAGQLHAAFEVTRSAGRRVLDSFAAAARVDELSVEERNAWLRAQSELYQSRANEAAIRGRCVNLPATERESCQQRVRAARRGTLAKLDRLAALSGVAETTVSQRAVNEATVVFRPVGDRILRLVESAGQVEALWVTATGLLSGDLGKIEHAYVVAPAQLRSALVAALFGPKAPGFSWSFVPGSAWREVEAAAGGRPLLVADPTRDLPYAAREGQTLAEVFGVEAGRLTADELRAALPRANLFHFAGHGVLQADDAWAAHLKLRDGSRLELADVLALGLRGQRVVLSGCETGGAQRLGVDSINLPEAFLAAGARSVVASVRVVEDAASQRFFEYFYQVAGGAEAPAEALARTAAKFRAAGDPIWDAFAVWGAR